MEPMNEVIDLPKTQICYTNAQGGISVRWGTPGMTAQELMSDLPESANAKEISEAAALALFINLESFKTNKLAEILDGANAMSARIKSKYSQPEIDSWRLQESEARILLTGGTYAPLVEKLAANADVPTLEFAKRIVANADAATMATEVIILQQQAMEKKVKDATTTEAVEAIVVKYTLD